MAGPADAGWTAIRGPNLCLPMVCGTSDGRVLSLLFRFLAAAVRHLGGLRLSVRALSPPERADVTKIAWPSSTTATIVANLWSVNTTSSASFETSVPMIPIATPMSAAFSAGASLTSSPVIATVSPFDGLFRITTRRVDEPDQADEDEFPLKALVGSLASAGSSRAATPSVRNARPPISWFTSSISIRRSSLEGR